MGIFINVTFFEIINQHKMEKNRGHAITSFCVLSRQDVCVCVRYSLFGFFFC